MSHADVIAGFDTIDGQLAIGGAPLGRLAARVGATPFFAYDRQLLTERVVLLRSTLPEQINLSYAVKANPMRHSALGLPAATSSRQCPGGEAWSASTCRTPGKPRAG